MAYRKKEKIKVYINICVYMKWQNALGLFKRFNVENKMDLLKGGRGLMWVELFVVKTSARILHIKTY